MPSSSITRVGEAIVQSGLRSALGIAALALLAAGCGGSPARVSDDGGVTRGDGSTPDGGPGSSADAALVRPDAGPPIDGGPQCEPGASVALVERLAPLTGRSSAFEQGFVLDGSRRLVSLPRHLSPSLEALTVVDLADSPPTVHALAAAGDIPRGRVDVYAKVPGSDRIVAIVRPPTFIDFEVVAVDFSATAATFSRLTSVTPPPQPGNYFVPALYATGPASLVAFWSDGFAYPLTIDGSRAQWGDPARQPASPATASGGFLHSVVSDPVHARVLAFGVDTMDDTTHGTSFAARMFQLMLDAPPYAWTELTLSGTAPPDLPSMATIFPAAWAAVDSPGNRVVVQSSEAVMSPFGGPMSYQPAMWIADLASGTWRRAADRSGLFLRSGTVPFAVDSAGERVLELWDTRLSDVSFGATAGDDTFAIETNGALAPGEPLAAARLADGRIAVTDQTGRIVSIDPAAAMLGWHAYGPTRYPADLVITRAATIAATPTGGLLVLGALDASDTTWSAAYEVTADESAFARVALSGAPPARSLSGLAQVGSMLYVVGGVLPGAGATPSDEVWELDVAAHSWRRVGTLAEGRMRSAVWASGAGELWVVGGLGGDSMPIERITAMSISTGATHPVTTDGAWPPGGVQSPVAVSTGLFAVSYGADDTIDMTNGGMFRLVADVTSGRATWTSATTCHWDEAFYPSIGVGTGDDGYLLGAYAWHVSDRP